MLTRSTHLGRIRETLVAHLDEAARPSALSPETRGGGRGRMTEIGPRSAKMGGLRREFNEFETNDRVSARWMS